MAEELHLDVVTTAESAGLTKAAHDVKDLKGESDKLGKSFDHTTDDSKELSRELERQADRIKGLRAEYQHTSEKIRDFNVPFVGGQNSDGNNGKGFGSLVLAASEAGVKAGGAFSSSMSSALDGLGPTVKPIVIGSLVAAVAAVSPGLFAMVGGVLAGGLGTAGMAAGILSASQDASVRAAAAQAGHRIADEFFSSDAFVKPTRKAIAIVEGAFHDINVGGSLAQLAPTVETIATGLADFGRNVMPGVNAALSRMGPFANATAEGFAGLGKAVGGFFDTVTRNEGAVEGLALAFQFVNGNIVVLGETIRVAEVLFHSWLSSQRDAFGAMRAAADFFGLDRLAGQLGHVEERYRDLLEAGKEIPRDAGAIGDGIESMGEKADLAAVATGRLDFALDTLHQGFLTWMGAEINVEQALDDLAEKFRGGAGALDVHTEKGRANLNLLQDVARDALAAAQAKYAETSSVTQAEGVYEGYRVQLEKTLVTLGYTKAKAHELAQEWLGIDALPNITKTITLNVKTKGGAQYLLSGATADLLGGLGFRAAGGPVYPGGTYVVGERGPEILQMGSGQRGTVYPNASAPSQGSMMNARPLVINIHNAGYGAEMLMETIRSEISARGGTLAVLGLRN
jgi:hypothetical protein